MQRSTFVIATLAILAAYAGPAAAQESSHTRHKYEACSRAQSPEPGVIEVRRCQGKSDIAVLWMSEPDSSSVSFGDKPLDEALDLGGAAFEVGSTIEWRTGRRGSTPVAAIVRYRVGAGVSSLNRSVLVVYRLQPSGGSCVMGVVGGADVNLARRVVDQSAGSFVCGKSARVRG